MSFESHLSTLQVEPRPFASASADSRPGGWLAKLLGTALLALSALLIVSLLSWSANDPSLTHLSTAKPKNWLGPIGAIQSDLVMHALGLAGLIALLPPVYWALQLMSQAAVERFRAKLVIAPIAVLSIAAFLSSLPRPSAWPIQTGLGGFLGDLASTMLASSLATINPDRAGLLAAIVFLAAGLGLMMLALGLTPSDVKAMAQKKKKAHEPDSSWVSRLKQTTVATPAFVATDAPAFEHAPDVRYVEPLPVMPPVAQPTAEARAALQDILSDPAFTTPVAMAAPAPQPIAQAPVVPPPPPAQAQPQVQPVAPVVTASQAKPVPAPTAHVPPQQPAYRLPPTSLLARSTVPRATAGQLHIAEKLKAERLKAVLAEFGVQGEVRRHDCGPVVTTFTFEPAAGTRPTRIISLGEDIARGLRVNAVRVQLAPGRHGVTVEVPHDDPVTIGLRDLIEHESYRDGGVRLPLALGATAAGEPCVADLAGLPHVLIAGDSDSARAELLNTVMASFVYRFTPQLGRVLIAGDSQQDLRAFSTLPHLAAPVATHAADALQLITSAAADIEARTLRLRSLAQSQSIEAYNARLRQMERSSEARASGTEHAPMPYLLVVIPDLAALTAVASVELEHAVHAIAWRGAAVGIHIVAAASRVDEEALPATLKAAFTTRLSFALASKGDSRAVFGEPGAEDLLGNGDMLAMTASDSLRRVLGGGQQPRLHAALLSTSEAARIANAIAQPVTAEHQRVAAQAAPVAAPARPAVATARDVVSPPTGVALSPVAEALYDRAVALVCREQNAHANTLRRHLGVSYPDALNILEHMARDRIVSAADDEGQRTVLIGRAA